MRRGAFESALRVARGIVIAAVIAGTVAGCRGCTRRSRHAGELRPTARAIEVLHPSPATESRLKQELCAYYSLPCLARSSRPENNPRSPRPHCATGVLERIEAQIAQSDDADLKGFANEVFAVWAAEKVGSLLPADAPLPVLLDACYWSHLSLDDSAAAAVLVKKAATDEPTRASLLEAMRTHPDRTGRACAFDLLVRVGHQPSIRQALPHLGRACGDPGYTVPGQQRPEQEIPKLLHSVDHGQGLCVWYLALEALRATGGAATFDGLAATRARLDPLGDTKFQKVEWVGPDAEGETRKVVRTGPLPMSDHHRDWLDAVLLEVDPPRALALLRAELREAPPARRRHTAKSIAASHREAALADLVPVSRAPEPEIRAAVIAGLHGWRSCAPVPLLAGRLDDDDRGIRAAAAAALGATGCAAAAAPLAAALADPEKVPSAARALLALDEPAAAGALSEALRTPDLPVEMRSAVEAWLTARASVRGRCRVVRAPYGLDCPKALLPDRARPAPR